VTGEAFGLLATQARADMLPFTTAQVFALFASCNAAVGPALRAWGAMVRPASRVGAAG
jgi:hypothetical protein